MSELIAITGGTVIDVRTGAQQLNATVLIDGDHIAAAGATQHVPESARAIDATGTWLLPGLMDMHGHTTGERNALKDRILHLYLAVWRDCFGLGKQLPGLGLQNELALLVESGLSPLAALQAATLTAAEALGQSDMLGTLEPGKLADIVLLEANPLEDIRNARRVRTVVTSGRVYDAATLREQGRSHA